MKGRIDAEIQKKVAGQEISVTEAQPEGKGKVIDLMEALRASLEKTEKARVTASKIGDRKAPKRIEQPAKATRKIDAGGNCRRETKMDSYSVRDVERVLHLSRSTIQGLIDGGFVKPARGPRRQYRFSFQDLIVLRAARAFTQAKVPRKRIHRALKDLRRNLPQTMPLSGISITAVGDRVVVREGKSRGKSKTASTCSASM